MRTKLNMVSLIFLLLTIPNALLPVASDFCEQNATDDKTGQVYTGVIIAGLGPNSASQLKNNGFTSGARVTYVNPESPADKAGMKAGDIIVTVNKENISDLSQISKFISDKKPGDKLSTTVLRNGSVLHFEIILGAVDWKEEAVTFKSGDISLSGTLMIPKGDGPFPALVMVHGSRDGTRNNLKIFGGDYFVRKGIAVLCYDKRGCGKSAGDLTGASFDNLADDVRAGVEFLKSRTEVKKESIGLWGISQGGWVCPLTALKSDDVSFLILISAPAVTLKEQNLSFLRNELKLLKVSDKNTEKIIKLNELSLELGRLEGEKREKQLEQCNKLHRELLTDKSIPNIVKMLLRQGAPENAAEQFKQTMLGLDLDYNPIPVFEKLTCPVLAIYGELDTIVSPKDNAKPLEKALKKSGIDYSIRVFPKSNHNIALCETGSFLEMMRTNVVKFPDGFHKFMAEWILNLTVDNRRIDG